MGIRKHGFWIAVLGATLASTASAQPSFVTFESGLVRPLALSPDGTKLFAVNTPDNRLEIFDVDISGITHSASVPVGMEPVAVAARTNTEVWVVNHLSDSVSIVALSGIPRVTRTLLVGDEPNDIVFAGPSFGRAFVTTAHRGQNTPNPQGDYNVPGTGRADVWVFDTSALGATLGGTPLTVVNLFSDKPRALAVTPDGSTVYAAAFHSGNRTTIVNEGLVCNTSPANVASEIVEPACVINSQVIPGGLPPPHRNQETFTRPETALIVRQDRDGGSSGEWQDELGRDWSGLVRFDLPDEDVFRINANGSPPTQTGVWTGVGTVLYNMAVNPISGRVYVSNTEAQNQVRFEGPGTLAAAIKPPGEPATVRGRLHEARISVINGGTVTTRHLNKHIDYADVPQPAGVEDDSLATPNAIAVSSDGTTLYVAAFGSQEIGVFDTTALENDTFVPDDNDQIALSGGGPVGLVLAGSRLFTLTRFNNAVVVVDLTQGSVGAEVQSVSLHNPEPAQVVDGRPFLYDAILTGSNGEASCSGCHAFGDMDDLAWDLGNPDDDRVVNGNPFTVGFGAPFHPMKGPMTTQSLRGLVNMGPQHWRGDRQGDANDAFNAFNVAFPGLIGRDEGEFSAADMQKFTDFVLEITYPPNPIRNLDNSRRLLEAQGLGVYNGAVSDVVFNCNGCHTLDAANGFFGGNGNSTIEGETQEFKVPHLRNAYQKIGMFGLATTSGLAGSFAHQGDQIRGFGFLHDGAIDTLFRFVGATVFALGDPEQSALEALMVAFDTDLPPMVGQQITRTTTSGAPVNTRINDMLDASTEPFSSKLLGPGASQCDVIVKGVRSGEPFGGLVVNGNQVQLDDGSALVSESSIRALSNTAGQELTYTCVPFGSGVRAGIDRDEDGDLDGVDNCPDVFNPNQTDSDFDGIGDVCDVGGATTTTTTTPALCGNGVADGGEDCDTADLAGNDCTTLGHFGGALACNLDCTFNVSGCVLNHGNFTLRTLKISRLTQAAGTQKLSLSSEEMDGGVGNTFFYNPMLEQVTFSFSSGATPLSTAVIPGGASGWSLRGKKYKWKVGGTPQPQGLTSIQIGVSGDLFRVKIKASDFDGSGASALTALGMTLQIGNDVWVASDKPCELSGSGSTLKCR
jgi:DNA-binding beta-propeller fold protein YncE